MQSGTASPNRAQFRVATSNRARAPRTVATLSSSIRDNLIRDWLTGTARGRAICGRAGLPLAAGITLTRHMIDTGQLIMEIGETRPDGTFAVSIRETAALTGRASA